MGRADVLLRFLQLIGKDRPRDLDPYLEGLDDDPEQRPLVDQIVDRILAGNDDLYEKYAQARKEVGTQNPYSSRDEKKTPAYEAQLGNFVSRWTELETFLRDKTSVHEINRPLSSKLWASWINKNNVLSEDLRWEVNSIRHFRNEVIHGMKKPSREQLAAAADLLERILVVLREQLNDNDGAET